MEENQQITLVEVVDIQFRPGQKVYFFDPKGLKLVPGDRVIIDTARGEEFGLCAGGNHTIPEQEVVAPLRQVLRRTTERDEKILRENRDKEKRALEVCLRRIEELGLDMQLVSAECAFDGSKILFFFTADERVDFRELVKSLASVFHTRIELRQIGVRDKAKMVGGLGICGRPFCCAEFLEDFQPVSIKMAKTQSLSLNPTKISGTCGRLMCCLKYEQEAYEDLLRRAPKEESFVDTPDGRGTIVAVELLRQRVRVRLEDQPETIITVPNDEIAVYRSGRAQRNDPPIPADWAPISGEGKRVREPEEPTLLDPIKFRYSTESLTEPEASAQPEERPARSRRNRKARGGEPREEKQEPKVEEKPRRPKPPKRDRAEKPERTEKPERAEKSEEPKAPGPNRHYRRYRPRRPKNNGQ